MTNVYVGYLEVGQYDEKDWEAVKVFTKKESAETWANELSKAIHNNSWSYAELEKRIEKQPEFVEFKAKYWDKEKNGWRYGSNNPLTIELWNDYNQRKKDKIRSIQAESKKVLEQLLPGRVNYSYSAINGAGYQEAELVD